MRRIRGICLNCGAVPTWKVSGMVWELCPECWWSRPQGELFQEYGVQQVREAGTLKDAGRPSPRIHGRHFVPPSLKL